MKEDAVKNEKKKQNDKKGKQVAASATTVDGPAQDIEHVRECLKVLIFEQKADAMEKRFGFRVQEFSRQKDKMLFNTIFCLQI